MSSGLENFLLKTWYTRNIFSIILRPLSWLFCVIVQMRRLLYRLNILRSSRLPVPVIIAGNISVGGTGKTPLVVYLAAMLESQGFRPGIISRGYQGKATSWPQQVRPDSDPVIVGDEAILISRRSHCPMAVGPRRIDAAQALLDYHDCDVIISDDGLQHYALKRDIEIAVIDGIRRFGNGVCLPAGPLREPLSRLQKVDFVITNGVAAGDEFAMYYEPDALVSLQDENIKQDLAGMKGQMVHAVAGIGHPQRFFDLLRAHGLDVIEHIFPDHHFYYESDIFFKDEYPVIMTEKDAVKCFRFSRPGMWYLPVRLQMSKKFDEQLLALLERK